MRFAIQYKHHGVGDSLPDYWRLIEATDATEAKQLAKQHRREGYHIREPIADVYRKE